MEKLPIAAPNTYLLDTHIILWLITDDKKLSESTKNIIKNGLCFISAISLWEVAIKFSIGKLRLNGGLNEFLKAVKELDF